ncbi:TetR family transcriptional regulator [Murinocardiopsis flavida]|uniref:TetR family transcriptional regulator n=1 Tax=Murinocardiopsis flavida TaxID=645275 RepID=A0A2P8DSR3_9ACTN|nr:TetR/AcrR family transcriptional regulator [Murinocardiopsis flavida]PSL00254.1 TetR family transcriptional regulator [Murinocardiopsis flavida]
MTGVEPLPPPVWLRSANKPVKRQLSLDAVLEAALRLLDSGDLESVSMRRVAQELGTGPASLYAYIGSKAELDELLYDAALAPVVVPEPDPERWRSQLLDLGVDVAKALAARPGTARVALETVVPSTPKALELMDGVLGLLKAGGIPAREAVVFADLFALHLTAGAWEMTLRSAPKQAAEETEVRAAQIVQYLDLVPADRLPHLREAFPLFGVEDDDPAAGLRTGLEMLVEGLVARQTGGG